LFIIILGYLSHETFNIKTLSTSKTNEILERSNSVKYKNIIINR